MINANIATYGLGNKTKALLAIKENAHDPFASNTLAYLQQLSGKTGKAGQGMFRAMKSGLNNIDIYYSLGVYCY